MKINQLREEGETSTEQISKYDIATDGISDNCVSVITFGTLNLKFTDQCRIVYHNENDMTMQIVQAQQHLYVRDILNDIEFGYLCDILSYLLMKKVTTAIKCLASNGFVIEF